MKHVECLRTKLIFSYKIKKILNLEKVKKFSNESAKWQQGSMQHCVINEALKLNTHFLDEHVP